METAITLDKDMVRKYTTVVTMRDGRTLHVRPILRGDEDKLISFFNRLNMRTVYLRFHYAMTHMSKQQAQDLCTVDYDNTFALVGIVGEESEEKIVAVARYTRLPKGDSAEVAFTIEDAYQEVGIGTQLLERLADIARAKGIAKLEGEVLAENKNMMIVFRDSGFKVVEEMEEGIYRVVLDTAPTEVYVERSAERRKTAAIASLRAFLEPSSLAVIGASQRDGSIGNTVFRNVLKNGFRGVLYPVNPRSRVVNSVRSYDSVLSIRDEVDSAVIIVPAPAVLQAVKECGRKGVKALVIISAGFGEAGPEGKALQAEVVEMAARYGMRIIGPNCMGLINTDPKVSMNTTFSRVFPEQGDIAFCTQSGALGLAILEYAKELNIGFSTFASIGNCADIDTVDFLHYYEQDPNTKVILLYMESFGKPREFARTARRISRTKPIVVVKSGRTSAGAKAAASHTGAMASADVASDALFKQAGITRVDTLEQLFDVAGLYTHQPIPRSRRVAILTNGGGPGIMTADACIAAGLEVPDLEERTKAALREFLSPQAGVVNPVDMTAGGGAEDYRKSLEVLVQDDNIDSVIIIFVPPVVTGASEVAAAIRSVMPEFKRRGKTLAASFMGQEGEVLDLGSPEMGYVQRFAFPESIALALSKAAEYSEWLRKPQGTIPELTGIDRDRAQQIVGNALRSRTERPLWLTPSEVEDLLSAYGIGGIPSRKAWTAKEAGEAAEELGFPVVIKLMSETITHKTDVGGVVLDVRSGADAEAAFKQIKERLAAIGRESEMEGVLVQKMITGGVETIVGMSEDPSFGPLILFGMGGVTAELFKDVTFRIHPLTDIDAREMIRSVKTYKLLSGWRGGPPADIEALEQILLRISAMVEDIPQLSELDLNPVKVLPAGQGCAVVDARILVNADTGV